MSASHYLRVEGVNLDAFVYDTRNLSTVRGGSLLLLDAVAAVTKHLGEDVETISRGASIGLFRIKSGEPAAHVLAVRKILAEGDYSHGTFMVDVVSGPADREANEAGIAANRWQQMQSSTLAVPELDHAARDVCRLDGVRPSDPNLKVQKAIVSPATYARWHHGHDQKQRFYEVVTRLTGLPKFATEFEDIASGTSKRDQKMAVFYADGNKFGSIQQKGTLAAWDTDVRAKRSAFLQSFLETEVLKKPKDWMKGDVVRFETLLWGGDELMFVMPAALGWRFAAFFFQQFKDWSFEGQPLTHSAALVFAHHHAPIHRLKRLAKDEMTEFAKETQPLRNQLVYTVLESFDHLGTSFEAAMTKRYGKASTAQAMLLPTNDGALTDVSALMEILRDPEQDFARSQLRALVMELIQDGTPKSVVDALKSHFFRAKAPAASALKSLGNLLPPNALWLHLEELWDYALP